MAKKLMIVDERAVARHLVRKAAASPLDTVLECASPAEALKLLGTFQPDCVLLGISCPPPGAWDPIKIIRKQHPEVRIVAVNQFDERDMRHAASEAGASGYVSTENLSELFMLAAPERLAASPAPPLANRRKKDSKV